MNPYIATLEGGWGVHSWDELNEHDIPVRRTYTESDVAAMVANGSIVTNSVFERSVAAMFRPANTTNEIYSTMAYNIPAVSFAAGSVATFDDATMRFDMNAPAFKNGWGRDSVVYGQRWLHSDMKNMSFRFIFSLYHKIVQVIRGEP